MAKTLSLSGIQTGQAIEAKHVTQSIDAFTGTEAYDITVSGSLTVQGPVQGTAGTLNNFSSSYALTASYALNGGSGGGGGGSVGTLQQVMESGSITTLVITASAGISSSGAIISPSFTGSLSGSALEAISASFAQTASYVLNAVSASFAQTASYVLNAISSSYALTASHALDAVGFPFSGSAQITGSLVISSSNQEQSLQLYGSGSTIFSIEGSRGTLFSIDDDESDGILFSANNVSGTPVLEVHEDNTVKLGKQNGFGIVISGSNPLPNDADAKILITGSIYHSGSSVNFNSFISASSFNAPPGVINQLTASYAISASVEVKKEVSSSYADTASYVETAQTASYVLNANNATDLIVQVKNTQDSTILKGQVLHSVGVTGENIDVITASNNSAASMPGFAVANQDINSNASGQAIISGKIKNIDTSGLTAGSNVYVNLNGGYTGTKPSGSSLIQNIGVVGKVNATEGELIILGAGRSNDVPNLLDNQIFFGSGSNQSQQIHISGALDSTIINNITASGNISASGNLFANVTDSSNTGFKTVMYDTATGQFFRTGSYGGGGGGGGQAFPFTGSAEISGSMFITGSVSMAFPSASSHQSFLAQGNLKDGLDNTAADGVVFVDDYFKITWDVSQSDIDGEVLINPSSGRVQIVAKQEGFSEVYYDANTGIGAFQLSSNFTTDSQLVVTANAPDDNDYPVYRFVITKGSTLYYTKDIHVVVEKTFKY